MGYSNTSKGRGIKGSKYWIQTVIEDECLRNKLDSMIGEPLVWISPLAGSKNTYDEYDRANAGKTQVIELSGKVSSFRKRQGVC